MSLKLEIKKKMLERSPRVKALDFHPEFTWVVLGLYSGTLALHDYSTNVITILCRRASGPSRHLFSQLEQLGLYLKIIGLYADLMIFM